MSASTSPISTKEYVSLLISLGPGPTGDTLHKTMLLQVKWTTWMQDESGYEIITKNNLSDIIVPTIDSQRNAHIIGMLLKNKKPVRNITNIYIFPFILSSFVLIFFSYLLFLFIIYKLHPGLSHLI